MFLLPVWRAASAPACSIRFGRCTARDGETHEHLGNRTSGKSFRQKPRVVTRAIERERLDEWGGEREPPV